MIDAHHGWNVSLKPVTLGFILSAILTFAAFRIVTHYHLSNSILLYTVSGIGCVNAVLQLLFFMHLGIESKPRWNIMMFLYLVILVIVLMGGTLWIMSNLNYNLMPDMNPAMR